MCTEMLAIVINNNKRTCCKVILVNPDIETKHLVAIDNCHLLFSEPNEL